MNRIDAHQHFWKYDPVNHSWIDDEMAAIRQDFYPADLKPLLEANGVDGCVAVQADQTEAETDFLLQLAQENDFIKGIVGWVDLRSENIRERLAHSAQFPLVKGFRHVLQGEEPEFMLHPDFKRGIAALREFNFTYDLLLFPRHLKAALALVKEFPDQQFVIDHIAKPAIKEGLIYDWEKDIRAIAKQPNVFCKVSGMVTEADYKHWTEADMMPYLDVIVDAFGIDRLMFGSDWPVCLVAASYQKMIAIVKVYFSRFTAAEQEAFFGGNAIKFYQL
jgi:L-fuconolactonase